MRKVQKFQINTHMYLSSIIYAERGGGMRYPLPLGDRVKKIRLIGKLRGIGNWYLFLISRADYL